MVRGSFVVERVSSSIPARATDRSGRPVVAAEPLLQLHQDPDQHSVVDGVLVAMLRDDDKDAETWALLGKVEKDAWLTSWQTETASAQERLDDARYEKPRLRRIKLNADEVMAKGCKMAMPTAAKQNTGCLAGGCNQNGS